ncbi:MAG: acyl-CoA dehydrogenase family protein [Dehalococcoidales bacterium]
MEFKEYVIGEFDTEEQKKLRKEAGEWLDKNISPELIQGTNDIRVTAYIPGAHEFAVKLGTKGWLVPEWPKEYGGAGLPAGSRSIIAEEISKRVLFGPGFLGGLTGGVQGPTIMSAGTPEQKKEWLPKIAAGAQFALGYTEPNAGTDLASLQIRGVKDGNDYILNGQKMFSTGAHFARYHWLAVRTNPELPKHKGVSMIIADLQSPGVTITQLTTIAGERTNEVFYDNVRVPQTNRIGPEGEGWSIIRMALTAERGDLGTFPWPKILVNDLIQYAKETKRNGKPLAEDPLVRQSLAQLATDVNVLRLFNYRVGWMVEKGLDVSWASSMVKIFESELSQRIANQGMNVMGLYGQLEPGSKYAQLKGNFELAYRAMVVRSFGGGSNLRLRNDIATRGMGLPREPALAMPVKK